MTATCTTCGREPNVRFIVVFRREGAADILRCRDCARILKAPQDYRPAEVYAT